MATRAWSIFPPTRRTTAHTPTMAYPDAGWASFLYAPPAPAGRAGRRVSITSSLGPVGGWPYSAAARGPVAHLHIGGHEQPLAHEVEPGVAGQLRIRRQRAHGGAAGGRGAEGPPLLEGAR